MPLLNNPHFDLKQNIANFSPPENHNVETKAAILIPIIEKNNELYLLLTQRSKDLRTHSGQVAFPGGKKDEEDETLFDTVLRESWEEIKLPKEKINIIGQLDQIISSYGYLVTPFVGWILNPFSPTANTMEIESTFEVPLTFFMDESHHTAEVIERRSYTYYSHHFLFGQYDIWGMTALLILRLLEVGLGHTPSFPVHHPQSPSWMELSQSYHD
ncbi:CoA pyrophosphatase [Deltaproteobacteria bacterium TL4]